MSWEQAWTVLRKIPIDWPALRIEKMHALYELGKDAKGGAIVEIGTWVGCGAIALALGTRDGDNLQVFTIDDRIARIHWLGGRYDPEDRQSFHANIELCGVRDQIVEIIGDAAEAARNWRRPVSLLFWDSGVFGRTQTDFEAWRPHLFPGSVYAIKDIEPPGFGRPDFGVPPFRTYRHFPAGMVFSFQFPERST